MRGPLPVQSQSKEIKDLFNKIIIEDLFFPHEDNTDRQSAFSNREQVKE